MSPARWVTVAASTWLTISAWLLPAQALVRANSSLVGLGAFVGGFLAMGVDRARRFNTALGFWAILSPFVFHFDATPAALNQFFVGLVILTASLWRGHDDVLGRHPAQRM